MNDTLIDAIWHCLKAGEAKTPAAIAAEAGEFLKTSQNKFRVETELLNLAAENKLSKTGDTFSAIPGKPLVKEKPIPTPKVKPAPKAKAPRKSKRATASTEEAESESADPVADLDEPSKTFIRENVVRLGSRYAAERFYQDDSPVDWFARKLAAKIYPEEAPSKYCRKAKSKRYFRPATAKPEASAAPLPVTDTPNPGADNHLPPGPSTDPSNN